MQENSKLISVAFNIIVQNFARNMGMKDDTDKMTTTNVILIWLQVWSALKM